MKKIIIIFIINNIIANKEIELTSKFLTILKNEFAI